MALSLGILALLVGAVVVDMNRTKLVTKTEGFSNYYVSLLIMQGRSRLL